MIPQRPNQIWSADFMSNALYHGSRFRLCYIEPGKPNQNAFVERFKRSVCNEVLNLYLFLNLTEVREIVSQWRKQYNEDRPHDALGGLPPVVYAQRKPENFTFEVST